MFPTTACVPAPWCLLSYRVSKICQNKGVKIAKVFLIAPHATNVLYCSGSASTSTALSTFFFIVCASFHLFLLPYTLSLISHPRGKLNASMQSHCVWHTVSQWAWLACVMIKQTLNHIHRHTDWHTRSHTHMSLAIEFLPPMLNGHISFLAWL